MKELESLILRMVKPKGNRTSGGFAKSEDLRRRLAKDIREMHRRELSDLIGRWHKEKRGPRTLRPKAGRSPILARYVRQLIRLRGRLRGKVVRARVRRDGSIRLRGKIYNSPSLAAIAVVKRSVNGWTFWNFERAPGDWVSLNELRR
jgi:hypothetical protein